MNPNELMTLYRHDLASYFRFSFNELHPHVTYQHNWHIDVLAHKFKQVLDGKIQKLIVNLPPRMLKSHCASIAFPSWVLGRDPRQNILCLHGHNNLGRDLHDSSWELMQSKRYRALLPHMTLTENEPRIKTNHGGSRQHLPLMGRLTGLGADIIIVDDPMTPADALCDTTRQQINRQFDENVLQRLTNKKTGAIIVVMQRLHENDLCGHLLATNRHGKKYRYYVNKELEENKAHPNYTIARLPSYEIEALIEKQLRHQLIKIVEKLYPQHAQYIEENQHKIRTPELVIDYLKEATADHNAIILTLKNKGIENLLKGFFNLEISIEDKQEIMSIPYKTKRAKYGAVVLKSQNTFSSDPFELPTEELQKLIQGVIWRDEHFDGLTLNEIAEREDCSPKYIRTQIMKSFNTLTAIAST